MKAARVVGWVLSSMVTLGLTFGGGLSLAAERGAGKSGEADKMSRGAFVGELGNWRDHYRGAAWEKAFAGLEQVSADTPDGVILVDGDSIRIIVMSYETKPAEEAVIESHREFIDIQMIISGDEIFRWWSASDLEVSEPYDAAKDIAFYKHNVGPLAEFAARPGWYAVFMPGDAHSTQIHPAGAANPRSCRKAVAKVRASMVGPTPSR